MKYLLILIVTFFIFNIAINSSSFANDSQQSSGANKVEIDEELSDLSLNDGKKWQMDEHTRESFSEMEKLFSNIELKDSSEEELKKYGTVLREGIDSLIQGCKMEGDAHDQLHSFLMPYIDVVDNLSEHGEKEEAIKIQRYLKIYKEFFE